MILSNEELFTALDSGRLVIDPQPSPRRPSIEDPDCPFDTHSVDLRLSDQISVPKGGKFAYDLTEPGKIADTIADHSKRVEITCSQPYMLKPHEFVLGTTFERIHLPIDPDQETCLAARIEGKSSRARFGVLIHFTAPTVHPGYDGVLTLEIANLGPAKFALSPGMHIAQLIIEEVKGIPSDNTSEFQGQSTPAGH